MVTVRKLRPDPGHTAYLLHVSLADITPLIWRRVWVEGPMHLIQLHHIMQAAMGWTDAHLHEFTIEGTRYGTPDEDAVCGLRPGPVIEESCLKRPVRRS